MMIKNKLLKASILYIFIIHFLSLGVSAHCLSPAPGVKTVKNFLQTALAPVGSTLYVWGGGWFENSDGSHGSNRIGVHSEWKEFYDSQNETYEWSD